MRVWFGQFVKWYTKTQYEHTVKLPLTTEEIESNLSGYEQLGLPGIIGSLDGTIIPVMATFSESPMRVGHKSNCTGVNAVFLVSHNRQILHVTPPFLATCVDSMIPNLDWAVQHIKYNEMYNLHPVKFRDEQGNEIIKKGVTLLVDGGYPLHKVFQTGGKSYETASEAMYCKYLESVRKDVECTFGILKSRFRILKYGMRIADRDVINCVIATCAGLHNELLEHDETSIYRTLDYEALDHVDADHFAEVDADLKHRHVDLEGCAVVEAGTERILKRRFDASDCIINRLISNDNQPSLSHTSNQNEVPETYASRRQLLMDNFHYANDHGLIQK
jgi:hypothetical protein